MSHPANQRKPFAWSEVFRRSAADALLLAVLGFFHICFWACKASIFDSHRLIAAGLAALSLGCLVFFKEACALWFSRPGRCSVPFARTAANVSTAMIYLIIVWLICRKQTQTILHPGGGDVLNQDLRGGPALNFAFYPPKAGFIRLYCQVSVGGRMLFAPFNVNVEP